MRDASPSITTMLGTTQLTLARCVKLVLRDGTELGFTDHDRDLVVPMASDFYDPVTYLAGHGLIVGDITLAVGLDSDNTEAKFPINEMISRAHVLSRRFNHADVYLFDVDWTQSVPEPLEIMKGHVADSRAERNAAVFEIRSSADYWNTVVGRLLSPRCTADFGDAQCGATPVNTACAVLQAISNMRFIVDIAADLADDYFRFGEAEFLTGDLAGTWPFEVVAYDGYTQEVEVLSPMPGTPVAGDQLLLRNGCSRVKSSDDATVPTCLTHNNVRRFRGFDRVPGTDRYLRVPIPGSGS